MDSYSIVSYFLTFLNFLSWTWNLFDFKFRNENLLVAQYFPSKVRNSQSFSDSTVPLRDLEPCRKRKRKGVLKGVDGSAILFRETAPVSSALRGGLGVRGSTTAVGVASTHQHPSANSRCRGRRLRQVRLSLGFNIGENAGFYLIVVLLPPNHPHNPTPEATLKKKRRKRER